MSNRANDIERHFSFLETEYNFKIIERFVANYGVKLTYKHLDVIVNLTYDYRDRAFYFTLIKGEDTQFPNDHDDVNIKSFGQLVSKNDPDFPVSLLNPNDDDYLTALNLNAEVLKKYGHEILLGKKWF